MSIGGSRSWLVAWALAVAVILTAGGLYFHTSGSQSADGLGADDYQLVDTDGQVFARTDFAGNPSLLFFGFTHCPDVCPTTLADIVGWYEALGEEARDLKAYFVTVDPERDTPEVLADYLGWAGRVTGLTGTPDDVARAIKAWGVHALKVPLESGGYTMSHAVSLLLLDRRGEFIDSIAYGEDQEAALAKLRRLMAI